ALSGADITETGGDAVLRFAQIVLGRHLEIRFAAGDQFDRHSGALGDRGVVARHRLVRSSVSVMTPLAPRLTVSSSGRAGIAAGDWSSAPITSSMVEAARNGRAASWINTRFGARSTKLSSPSRTESCRAAPPATGGSRSRPAAAVSYSAASSGLNTTPTRSIPAWRVRVSSEWRSTGLPASGRYCFGIAPPK